MTAILSRSTRSTGSRSPKIRRGEVLRTVVVAANERRDAALPWDLPGVSEVFPDDLGLVAALQLRWHTRLSGSIERALLDRPGTPEQAVLDAWAATAGELPGVRLILDAHTSAPTSPEMAEALARSRRKDWVLMAAMAGIAGPQDEAAVSAGRELEHAARSQHGALGEETDSSHAPRHRADQDERPVGLVGRIKAALAA